MPFAIHLSTPPERVMQNTCPPPAGGRRASRCAAARELSGWPRRRKLGHALLREYSYERLKLAQLLGHHGAFLTCAAGPKPNCGPPALPFAVWSRRSATAGPALPLRGGLHPLPAVGAAHREGRRAHRVRHPAAVLPQCPELPPTPPAPAPPSPASWCRRGWSARPWPSPARRSCTF
jgi:hypothetical protein